MNYDYSISYNSVVIEVYKIEFNKIKFNKISDIDSMLKDTVL